MSSDSNGCSRRDFFKVAGAAGAGALLSPLSADARTKDETLPQLVAADNARVPTRPFGKTGVQVSILALGGMFDIAANQLMLRQAIKWGVTYWDTADCYHSGSEAGIGKYFAKYPEDREKIFLVTKSDARDPDGMSKLLARSLSRMNTSHIDLYFLHGVRNIDELNDDTRRWAQRAKKDGKIKFFGFSTHRNMETLLPQAAKLGYIDGIMLTYNFRNMHTPEMKNAVDACVQAGIGLTAMKTQAERSWMHPDKGEKAAAELMDALIKKGLTEQQAKLKAVWASSAIASICSQMPNMTILKANVQAAMEPQPLGSSALRLLRQYARATAAQYCAGCGRICEAAVNHQVPIGDIMRYHMYSGSYERPDWARAHFQRLGDDVCRRLNKIDYRTAEQRCPQGMPIGKLMRQALDDFS